MCFVQVMHKVADCSVLQHACIVLSYHAFFKKSPCILLNLPLVWYYSTTTYWVISHSKIHSFPLYSLRATLQAKHEKVFARSKVCDFWVSMEKHSSVANVVMCVCVWLNRCWKFELRRSEMNQQLLHKRYKKY